MKTCSTCKEEKSFTYFPRDKTKKSGLHNRCKSCQKKLSRLHYLKNKQKYKDSCSRHKDKKRKIRDSYKSCPCSDCKIQYPPWIMQFDHVNNDKSFSISSSMFTKTLKEIENEIKKCEVVCANCHAHRTFLKATKHKNLT